jgi:hypothetical protein
MVVDFSRNKESINESLGQGDTRDREAGTWEIDNLKMEPVGLNSPYRRFNPLKFSK